MTAVSFINPYAPQPANGTFADNSFAAVQTTQPVAGTKTGGDAGLASDQSGQGAGNGTGTGGAQLSMLLKKGRGLATPQRPTPESVVEAQSGSDPATDFLAQQAQLKIDAKAAEDARAAKRMAQQAADKATEDAKAAQPEYVMPNPLPTAPILQRDEP